MRHHHGLIRIAIALLCAISTTATTTIAEEALPVVQARRPAADEAVTLAAADAVLPPDAPTVDIPTEPLRDYDRMPMTLAEAARANDYAAFDAAYRRANEKAAYSELHSLWTYAVTDPIGGFYGQPMHDRLARAYPRYAAYIEDFRIVDQNGNVFYPSAETRAFLTEQAMAGIVPQTTAAPAPRVARVTQEEPVSGFRLPVSAPKRESVTVASKPAPAIVPAPTSAPVVVPAEPVVPVAQQAARKPETGNRQPIVARSSTGRGLLLIIIGLLGIGALTMMLRTPAEDLSGAERVEPPLKFTKAGGEQPAEPRATGSHG